MARIDAEFIKSQYRSGVASYADFTRNVGLWDAEAYVFEKYLHKEDHILDLGCGTGRTTFPLYKSGFRNIVGVDLTSEMIEEAKKLNMHFDSDIEFLQGDARSLPFSDASFHAVIFSFNGIMSIPGVDDRTKALIEIRRVLKPSGHFIFTTHDRDQEPQFFQFWKDEAERWSRGEQDLRLFEYGDLITHSKNEERPIFIHIPDQKEVESWMSKGGFSLVETFYRSDRFQESEEVLAKSGECRFWVYKLG